MYSWYKRSAKCYAYLADVGRKKEEAPRISINDGASRWATSRSKRLEEDQEIRNSKWFTRAWTLQELLAPSSVRRGAEPGQEFVGMEFFSSQWKSLGTKLDLKDTITAATGINQDYLTGQSSLDSASISMRMSWAAERRATRAEDIAYSLLGIFDVNMPLLYGEGKVKAFRRLQEEIMKTSEDETLFAWESTELTADPSSGDALASDPSDFSEARDLLPFASDDPVIPYALTHRGLRIWLQIDLYCDEIRPLRSPVMLRSPFRLHAAVLRCHVAHDFNHVVVIPLSHLTANLYIRDTTTNVGLLPVWCLKRFSPTGEVYIRNNRITSISNSVRRRFGFLIRVIPPGFRIVRAFPTESWNRKDRIMQGEGNAQGLRYWNASLELNVDAEPPANPSSKNPSLQSKQITGPEPHRLPSRSSIFLSFGCRQEAGDSEVKPWCHLDNMLWPDGERNLEDFNNSAFQKQARQEVETFRSTEGRLFQFPIRVTVSMEKVFGQHMFVVDLSIVRKDSLAIEPGRQTVRAKTA